MPQYVSTQTQTVTAGQNVRFDAAPVPCSKGLVMHREGSGIFTLRGPSNGQHRARYLVRFNGNIAVAAGGTAGPVSVALAINGEPLYAATATVTPAAIGDFFNVSASTYIDVPCGCCASVAVENVINPATPAAAATPIDVANASLIITREA